MLNLSPILSTVFRYLLHHCGIVTLLSTFCLKYILIVLNIWHFGSMIFRRIINSSRQGIFKTLPWRIYYPSEIYIRHNYIRQVFLHPKYTSDRYFCKDDTFPKNMNNFTRTVKMCPNYQYHNNEISCWGDFFLIVRKKWAESWPIPNAWTGNFFIGYQKGSRV